MSWWVWVLGTWAVVGGGVGVWLAAALTETERQERRAVDASAGSPPLDDRTGRTDRPGAR